ncbi:hypothetical protein PASLES2_12260 [Pseudomonas aeruginosa]
MCWCRARWRTFSARVLSRDSQLSVCNCSSRSGTEPLISRWPSSGCSSSQPGVTISPRWISGISGFSSLSASISRKSSSSPSCWATWRRPASSLGDRPMCSAQVTIAPRSRWSRASAQCSAWAAARAKTVGLRKRRAPRAMLAPSASSFSLSAEAGASTASPFSQACTCGHCQRWWRSRASRPRSSRCNCGSRSSGSATPLASTWIRKALALTPSKQAPRVNCSSRIMPRLHQSEAAATPPAIASGAM